ncbi:MAG: 50S ribosomal protein L9 [Rickettsiaceae bacterium]|nr:50S ribosomal protein L9 [Rickettsiaceae bacterium]
MQIILTKPIRKLGKIGDIVNVSDGYGRNYLLPQNLAIRATENNIASFTSIKEELEKKNKTNISQAEKLLKSLEGKNIIFAMPSSTDGKLFGSISARNIAEELSKIIGSHLNYGNIALEHPIKYNGVYDIKVILHPEVSCNIIVVIAKTHEEAQSALQDYTANTKANDQSVLAN